MSRRFTGGSSDAVNIGTWSFTSFGATIVCWVHPFSTNSGRDDRYISKADGTGTANHDWMLGASIGLKPRARFNRTDRTVVSPNDISLNTWTHTAATWDGSGTVGDIAIFVNGVWEAATSTSFADTGTLRETANTIYIGNQPTSSAEAPDALLADAAVWNRKLTVYELLGLGRGRLRPFDLPLGLIYYNSLEDKYHGWKDESLFRRNTLSITGTSDGRRDPPYVLRPKQRRVLAKSGAAAPAQTGTLGQFDPELRIAAWF